VPASHGRRSPHLAAPWLLALALALLAPGNAGAQLLGGNNPPGASNLPINVQSDSGIEWQQNAQIYIARGNAVATRGPGEIHADTLIAHYREARGGNGENNTEIYRIEAEGNVTIKRENTTVVGDRADYDLDQAVGIVRGKALKMTTTADVITARDVLEWYDTKQIAVARGDAVAVHNGRTMKADILTAYMVKTAPTPGGQPGSAAAPGPAGKPGSPAKPGTTPAAVKPGAPPAPGSSEESKINRVDGQGHVVVIGALDIGRGDYGVYNAATGICTLLGNVVITREKDVITGQYAVMDLNKNVSRVMPASSLPGGTRQRVQGLFVKQDQIPGQPASGKAAGPAAPPGPAPAPGKSP